MSEPSPISGVAAILVATDSSPGAMPTLAEEQFRGGNLLRTMAQRLDRLDAVVVVVRDEEAAGLVDGLDNVVVLVDPEWSEGASSPVRAGLDFLQQSGGIDEAFVIATSLPEVDPEVLQEMVLARREAGTLVAVPKYRYIRSGPVLLGRDIWPRFLGAEGQLDVEALLLAHPQWVTEVRVDVAPPRRILTSADLADMR